MKIKLGDLTLKIGSGATPRGGKATYRSFGTPFIRSQNVLDFEIEDSEIAYLDERAAHGLRNAAVEKNDVLVNITGDSVARVARWDREPEARVSQHVAIVRPDPQLADSRFLQYALLTPQSKSQLLTLSSGGGSRKALTKSMLEDFEIVEYSIDDQWAIAEVLGALDDKIAANRRVLGKSDALLAAMVSRLLNTSHRTLLGSLMTLNYGKALPVVMRQIGDVQVVGSGGVVGTHSESLVDGPCVVLGRKGSVGTAYWIDGPAFPIDTTYWVEPLGVPLIFLYYLLKGIDFAPMSSDSAVPGLNRDRAYQVEVPKVAKRDLGQFETDSRNLVELRKSIGDQNEKLAATRDELLPLLMSGRITVKDAEKRVDGEV